MLIDIIQNETLPDFVDRLVQQVCNEKGISRECFYKTLLVYKKQIDKELKTHGIDCGKSNRVSTRETVS